MLVTVLAAALERRGTSPEIASPAAAVGGASFHETASARVNDSTGPLRAEMLLQRRGLERHGH